MNTIKNHQWVGNGRFPQNQWNGLPLRLLDLWKLKPKLKKTCPFVGVRKVSKRLASINANFNTSVRNRIAETLGVELNAVEYVNGETWYRHLMTRKGKPLPVVCQQDQGRWQALYSVFPAQVHQQVRAWPAARKWPRNNLTLLLRSKASVPTFKPWSSALTLPTSKNFGQSGCYHPNARLRGSGSDSFPIGIVAITGTVAILEGGAVFYSFIIIQSNFKSFHRISLLSKFNHWSWKLLDSSDWGNNIT